MILLYGRIPASSLVSSYQCDAMMTRWWTWATTWAVHSSSMRKSSKHCWKPGFLTIQENLFRLTVFFLRLLYQRLYAHGYLKQKTDYYIVISAWSLLMTLNLRRKARSPICCGHRPQKHLVQDRKRALFSQNVDDRSALSNLPVLACVSIHQLKIAGTAV